MRISDWSSDVCSSDLPVETRGQILRHLAREGDDMADAALPDHRIDLAGERGAAKQAVRHRIASQDVPRKRERAQRLAHFRTNTFANTCHLPAPERGVGFIVGERSDTTPRAVRKPLAPMPARGAPPHGR